MANKVKTSGLNFDPCLMRGERADSVLNRSEELRSVRSPPRRGSVVYCVKSSMSWITGLSHGNGLVSVSDMHRRSGDTTESKCFVPVESLKVKIK